MKLGPNSWICVLSSLFCCAGAQAIETEAAASPYQGIVDRNVFGLKPPPPPGPTAPEPPPAPKVTLTGITTILGKKQVLGKFQMPAKPPEQAKEVPFILAEGEASGDIEILEVDVKAGNVKLKDYGTLLTLNLEKDGAKLPSTPATAVAGVPGLPQPAGTVPNPFQAQNPALKSLPTRTLRVPPNQGGAMAPSADVGGAVPNSFAATGASTPGIAMTTPGVMTVNPAVPGQPVSGPRPNYPPEVPMTAAEQAVLMEAQREAEKNNPNFPPLPPTTITQGATPQNPNAAGPGRFPVPVLPIPGRPPLPQ
jgi:hypothetical protein